MKLNNFKIYNLIYIFNNIRHWANDNPIVVMNVKILINLIFFLVFLKIKYYLLIYLKFKL